MLLLKADPCGVHASAIPDGRAQAMNLDNILDQDVKTLSGGELQRVAITLALGA